ncbi:MAG: hypothetical protein RIS88_523 [Pseudomonadota bacterium]
MDADWTKHAKSGSLLDSTHLIEIKHGTHLSETVRMLRQGSFELANGTPVRFDAWYRTSWVDTRVTWMTQVNDQFGLIFGASTGERGRKYTINPSLKLGMLWQEPMSRTATLSLRASTVLGGRLKEKSCIADYGEIGGVQEVNCRLVASTLQPAETLRLLLDEKPRDRHQVGVTLTWRH